MTPAETICAEMDSAADPDEMSMDEALDFYEEIENHASVAASALRDDIKRRDDGG